MGLAALHEGHRILPDIFGRAEMRELLGHLSRADLKRSKGGARHLLAVAAVRELAEDARMRQLASEFLEVDAIPFKATLFDKSRRANWLVAWHQDTALPLQRRTDDPDWGPWSMKAGLLYAHAPAWALEQVVALRVSLDDSSADNGPLRVLPNTHRGGVLTAEEIKRFEREVPPVECVTPSGGVIVMRPLAVHASSKSASARPRRVLHIEYATLVNLGTGIELAVA